MKLPARLENVAASRKVKSVKQWSRVMVAMLAGLSLAACGAGAPAPSQPPITAGALDSAGAYLQRGDRYAEIKDYDHAIADYSQAIRLQPDGAEAYNNRGLAYALSGKSAMPNAIADYSQAIQLRPTYAYAYNNRGVAYMASGHAEEALADFNRAIQLQSDFPQAYSNRGNVFYRAGRYDLAIYDFLRAEKLPLGWLALLLAMVLLGAAATYRGLVQRRLTRTRRPTAGP